MTYPMPRRSSTGFVLEMSFPLMKMLPFVGVFKRLRSFMSVVLPHPLGPIRAVISPSLQFRFIFLCAANPLSYYFLILLSYITFYYISNISLFNYFIVIFFLYLYNKYNN